MCLVSHAFPFYTDIEMIHFLPTLPRSSDHEAVVLHVLSSFCACFSVCILSRVCVYAVSDVSFRAFLACLQSYIRCLAAAPSRDPLPPSTLTARPSLTPLHSGAEKPTTSLPLPTPSALLCMRVTGAEQGEARVLGQSCSTVTSSEPADTGRLLRRHRGHKIALLHCCVNSEW